MYHGVYISILPRKQRFWYIMEYQTSGMSVLKNQFDLSGHQLLSVLPPDSTNQHVKGVDSWFVPSWSMMWHPGCDRIQKLMTTHEICLRRIRIRKGLKHPCLFQKWILFCFGPIIGHLPELSRFSYELEDRIDISTSCRLCVLWLWLSSQWYCNGKGKACHYWQGEE